tara:strand:+ start:544 stop:924 length:381 start_codon:yes stop_codon:yes gene_type:complete
MARPHYISATIIPFFYSVIGVIFLFTPEIPSADISPAIKMLQIPLLFTQEIGILFVIIAIFFRQIFNTSRETYLLMNNTFKLNLFLLALIAPYLYYYTKTPQLLVIFGINVFFICLLQYEKKHSEK